MYKYKQYQFCQNMRSSLSFTIFLPLFFILFSALPSLAETYFVKNGGNDNLDGLTDATAWATIEKVSNSVARGDTVYFRSQDTWSSSLLPVLNAKEGVTYDGSTYGHGLRARLLATGGYPNAIWPSSIDAVVNIYVSDVSFKGFEVDANEQDTGGIYIGFHAVTDTSNITIDNCVVHDNGGDEAVPTRYYYGILVGQSLQKKVSNVKILNTEVYNTGHEGISIYPSRGVVGTSGPSGNHVDNVLIRNCIVHDTALWGGVRWGNGIDVGLHSDNVTIEFNTVYNSGGSGIAVITYSDIPSPGSPNNVNIRYNLLYNNANGIVINPGAGNGHFGSSFIIGNILINNGIFLSGGKYNLTSQKFYNNTIYIPTEYQYGIYFVQGASGTSNIEFINNIFYTSALAIIKDEDKSIINHSYNILYRSSGTYVITTLHNYTKGDIDTWEPSVKTVIPNFKGGSFPTGFTGEYGRDMVPNTDYFSVTSGNSHKYGANLGPPYNGCINGAGLAIPFTRPASGPYDIGAYQDTTPLSPPEDLRVVGSQ